MWHESTHPDPRRRDAQPAHTQRGMTLIEIMIVLAILALVMGLLVGPRVMDILGDSKVDIAKLAVRKLANEAFPQWLARHPDKACPERIEELAELTDSEDAKDPWGGSYRMACPPGLPAGAKRIAIMSAGPDGKEGTDDDVRSW
jgi:general secretion pathway protein G